jgi:5-dehydro-4-deoxyglucarate dehydratase
VSIVKGGMKAIGRDMGSVRAPLQDLTAQDLADLSALIDAAGVRPADAGTAAAVAGAGEDAAALAG